jgi:putative ABC transport system permease protein
MLFKLSLKNMKKSFKDYAIYFLTLVLGVALFYMFNSIDSQQAMLEVSKSTRDLIKLMISLLGFVSVFIAVVLGFLIVYANNFLINRRKREFGIYMTLGMGKRQISKIILIETIIIGILSLAVGLIIGIFASQFMSVLVAKLFDADMTEFTFVFSINSCVKTCVYFAVMYIAVMIFNTMTISRYKLINLLNANKRNEEVKIKNPIISVMVFILSVLILGYAYYLVTKGINKIITDEQLLVPILLGIVGTAGVFWSLSGFFLKVIQSRKKLYLSGTNMFVLRQLNNKINTTVVSMTVICLMLFMTITVLSSSLSLQTSMDAELEEMTPVDVNLYKTAELPESYKNPYTGEITKYSNEQIEDSKHSVLYTLENNGYDINNLKDITEITVYSIPGWTWKESLGDYYNIAKEEMPTLRYNTQELIIKVSDYNKIARLYGLKEYSIDDKNEYIMLCDYDSMENLRNPALKNGGIVEINGNKYHSKYDTCMEGFYMISTSHTNTGIILVSDDFDLKDEWKEQEFLAANFNTDSEEEKEELNLAFSDTNSTFYKNLDEKEITLDGMTKISIMEASKGVASMVIFIAIYLGIIFLIASAAILALKQLTESSDNKYRYTILRKIGCDEKMINKALFRQIFIFFMLPIIVAIIHSIFGIQFVLKVMSVLSSSEELLPSVILTAIIIGLIYGLYFYATYSGSKRIIKND